jgi:peptidyl-prolyl cis-trans isomerase D
MYEESLRSDLARRQLAGGIAASETVPKSLAHAVYRHRQEQRVAEILFIPNDSITGLGAPDQASLETFHKDNEARFMAPEFRKVTAVIIRPDDLAANIEVSDERLEEEYRSRLDEFETSERRAVEQLLFNGESEAKAAYDRIRAGEDFAAVGADVLPLGTVVKGDLPLAALADGAFALAPDTASSPIKTALGWHIVRVTKIEPGSTMSFADAREKLKTLVKGELAVDAAINLGEDLDKEIGGGTSITDAAARFGLTLTRIAAMDAKGQDAEGKPIAGLPQGSDFVEQAFQATTGDDGLLSDAEDGSYFILRVDGITPAAVRPLADIRAKVAAAWTTERKAEEAKKRAQSVTERLSAGTQLSDLAREIGREVRITEPFTRDGDGAGDHVSAALVEKLFVQRVGKAAWAPTQDGAVVGVAKEVTAANPLSDSKGVKSVSDRLRQAMASDLLTQFTNALRDRYPVEIDQAAVEDMFSRQ